MYNKIIKHMLQVNEDYDDNDDDDGLQCIV